MIKGSYKAQIEEMLEGLRRLMEQAAEDSEVGDEALKELGRQQVERLREMKRRYPDRPAEAERVAQTLTEVFNSMQAGILALKGQAIETVKEISK